jgi:hypothetical protein
MDSGSARRLLPTDRGSLVHGYLADPKSRNDLDSRMLLCVAGGTTSAG